MCPGKVVRVEDCSAEIRAGIPPIVLSRRGEQPGTSGAGTQPDPETARTGGPGRTGEMGDGAEAGPAGIPDGEFLYDPVGNMTLHEARQKFERRMILGALERSDWNVSRAADELGLERTNLHKKIKQFGLTRR